MPDSEGASETETTGEGRRSKGCLREILWMLGYQLAKYVVLLVVGACGVYGVGVAMRNYVLALREHVTGGRPAP